MYFIQIQTIRTPQSHSTVTSKKPHSKQNNGYKNQILNVLTNNYLHHGHKQLASCGGVFETQDTCACVFKCVCRCVYNVEEYWRLTLPLRIKGSVFRGLVTQGMEADMLV